MYTDPLFEPALLEARIKKHQKTETPEPLTFGVNIYTDGGCKGRDAGYGVHGYVYCNTPVKTGCGVTGYSTTDYGYIVNNKLVQGVMISDMFDIKNRGPAQVQIVQPFVYFDGLHSLKQSLDFLFHLKFHQLVYYLLKQLLLNYFQHYYYQKY